MKISAVIPLYNEEEVIDEFSSRLIGSLQSLGSDYEVIFVVEGTDATLAKVSQLSKQNPRVRVEYNQKRLGLGKALKKGLEMVDAGANYVLTMDSDLNHDPDEIGRLLKASEEADVVVGCRSRSRGLVQELPFFKRMISASTNWILRRAFKMKSSDITSGFRIYSTKAVSITEVPISFKRRPRGTSKLSFVKSGVGYVILLFRLGF